MALTLAIENITQLPDGGPTSIRVPGRRGIDIGRDQHLDWTLPDPERFISGKHCEIRYRDGAYWLHDVSSNGTFVNGSERRPGEPHRLRNGDRLEIGQYIIAVTVEGEELAATPAAAAAVPMSRAAAPGEMWGVSEDVAPPVAAAEFKATSRAAPVHPDFLDWVVDVPDIQSAEPAFRPPPAAQPTPRHDASWDSEAPPQPAPPRPAPGGSTAWPSMPPDPSMPPEYPAFEPPAAETLAREPEPAPAAFPPPPAAFSPPPPVTVPQPAQGAGAAPDTEFLRRLARGAGIPETVFAGQAPGDVAEELGVLMRAVAENLKQLLGARAESRGLVRASQQTMIQAVDNNPLKFSPTAEDALRVMFGPRSRSYLDAHQTLRQSFDDIKGHQINTFAAMQQALRLLAEDLDPHALEKAGEGERRIGGLGSRKARLWDAYVARWDAKTSPHDDGLVDAFMLYFSECYQRNTNRNR